MKLSIITVNYNDAVGLERTIKSVISQTFQEYEFIFKLNIQVTWQQHDCE